MFGPMKNGLWMIVFFWSIFSYGDLVVYTYDSLTGKGSLGKTVEEEFSKISKTKIRWVAFGSSGEALSQLILEGAKSRADVLWGIDQSQMVSALRTNLFSRYAKELETGLNNEVLLDSAGYFLPFDYGYLAFVYDSLRTKSVPKSLKEFSTDKTLHKKVVIQDPRTSSLGLGFLVWTHSVFGGDQINTFWKDFSRQLLTVSPGWSASYGMFLKKEADFVLSYTTSPAYHVHEEKKDHIKAVIFPEGHYRQVEFAGIVKSSTQQSSAQDFLKVLVSSTVQQNLPTKQWMYPARKAISLPESFKGLSIPKSVKVDLAQLENKRKSWIQDWSRSFIKAH